MYEAEVCSFPLLWRVSFYEPSTFCLSVHPVDGPWVWGHYKKAVETFIPVSFGERKCVCLEWTPRSGVLCLQRETFLQLS